MADEAPPQAPARARKDAAAPRVGIAGWVHGLLARASEPDVRQAALVTAVVLVVVIAVGRMPLRRDVEIDLRGGDAVGGQSQLTLVGFSITRPFGRVLPDHAGRTDLRIISNRPLPPRFTLALDGWTLRPGHPVELSVMAGDERRSARFSGEMSTQRMQFEQASSARVLELSLGPGDKLAVQRIAIIPAEGPE